MNRYVVGFLSFFDNELSLIEVEANSDIEALKKVVHDEGYDFDAEYVNEFIDLCLDCDLAVNVHKVTS